MANKIKLGAKPKTFKPVTIKCEMPDGTEGAIEVTYKYFTKTESGALFDEMRAAAEAKMKADASAKPDDPEVAFSLESVMAKTRDQNAAFMLRVVDSWNLDEKLSLKSLQQLDDELPAFSVQIMDRFRSATQLGRLGN